MNRDIQWVNVRIPKSHWSQIVSDLEDMCGCSQDEIEILAEAVVTDDTSIDPDYTDGQDGYRLERHSD